MEIVTLEDGARIGPEDEIGRNSLGEVPMAGGRGSGNRPSARHERNPALWRGSSGSNDYSSTGSLSLMARDSSLSSISARRL